jgi:hypothetical protein
MNLPSRRVAALSLRAIVDQWCSTFASYVSDEKIRGNGSLPFPRYALHNVVVGPELYLINCVEQGKPHPYHVGIPASNSQSPFHSHRGLDSVAERWWRWLPRRRCQRLWDDWRRGQPERAKCSNESAMVRLPDYRFCRQAANFFRSLRLSSFR